MLYTKRSLNKDGAVVSTYSNKVLGLIPGSIKLTFLCKVKKEKAPMHVWGSSGYFGFLSQFIDIDVNGSVAS